MTKNDGFPRGFPVRLYLPGSEFMSPLDVPKSINKWSSDHAAIGHRPWQSKPCFFLMWDDLTQSSICFRFILYLFQCPFIKPKTNHQHSFQTQKKQTSLSQTTSIPLFISFPPKDAKANHSAIFEGFVP